MTTAQRAAMFLGERGFSASARIPARTVQQMLVEFAEESEARLERIHKAAMDMLITAPWKPSGTTTDRVVPRTRV